MSVDIEIQNNFSFEDTNHRRLCVYHHRRRETAAISYDPETFDNSRITCSVEPEMDHLSIYVEDSRELLPACKINLQLPSDTQFTFIPGGIPYAQIIPTGTGTAIRIPPAPPTWSIQIKCPATEAEFRSQDPKNVTVGDDGDGGGGF